MDVWPVLVIDLPEEMLFVRRADGRSGEVVDGSTLVSSLLLDGIFCLVE